MALAQTYSWIEDQVRNTIAKSSRVDRSRRDSGLPATVRGWPVDLSPIQSTAMAVDYGRAGSPGDPAWSICR